MDCLPMQDLFPHHAQRSRDSLRIQRDPDQDKLLTEDEYGCNVVALQPKSVSHHALTSVFVFD